MTDTQKDEGTVALIWARRIGPMHTRFSLERLYASTPERDRGLVLAMRELATLLEASLQEEK